MPAQETFTDQLRDDIRDGKVALILGTGFSTASVRGPSITSWIDLIQDGLEFIGSLKPNLKAPAENFKDMLQASPETDELISAAEWLRRKFSPMPGEFQDWLTRTVGGLEADVESKLHLALPPTRYVLTTNYDVLAATLTGRKPVTWTTENAENEYQRNSSDYVFHVHGLYTDPKSVVLSGGDYGRLEENGTSFSILTEIARHSSLLLVGYGQGLNDPNFQRLMAWLREHQRNSPYRHYILIREADMENMEVIHQLGAPLTPIVYGSEYGDLPIFLNNLKDISPTPTTTPSEDKSGGSVSYSTLLQADLPAAVEAHIEEQLGKVDALNPFQTRALGAMASAASATKAVLICAVTGTGKTTLSRVAINAALAHKTSGIELLPTKALVHQEVQEWARWADIWDSNTDRKIRIYGSSLTIRRTIGRFPVVGTTSP